MKKFVARKYPSNLKYVRASDSAGTKKSVTLADIKKFVEDNDLIIDAVDYANDHTEYSGQRFRNYCSDYIQRRINRKFKNIDGFLDVDIEEYLQHELAGYGQGWEEFENEEDDYTYDEYGDEDDEGWEDWED